MIYVYDIILNFNNKIINFYEWNNKNTKYYRKIPMFRVDSKLLNNIFNNKVKIENDFLKLLVGKSEEYSLEMINRIDNICLLSDTYEVIALMFDSVGNIIKKSRLYISDEQEVLELSTSIKPLILDYKVKKIRKVKKKNSIDDKINKIINNSENDLINYLGYDWFNKDNLSKNELLELVSSSSNDEKRVFLNSLNCIIK